MYVHFGRLSDRIPASVAELAEALEVHRVKRVREPFHNLFSSAKRHGHDVEIHLCIGRDPLVFRRVQVSQRGVRNFPLLAHRHILLRRDRHGRDPAFDLHKMHTIPVKADDVDLQMTGPEIPLHDSVSLAGQKLTGHILTPTPQFHPWSHLFFSVFHSLDSNEEKIYFQVEGKIIKHLLIFEDKSTPNTIIYLAINKDNIILDRVGDTNMHMNFKSNQIIEGYYKNKLGLEFRIFIKTNNLIIKTNKIEIDYDLIIDDYTASSHKIWILFQ